jgi:hypothetical protein
MVFRPGVPHAGVRASLSYVRRAVDSEPLRQAYIELGPRRHAVQTEIAAEIELHVRTQRVSQSFIQSIDEWH